MDTGLDLTTAPREALLAVIARQQAVIDQLQRRIETLEGEAKPGGPKGMPGIKPKSGRQQTPREKGPREKGPREKGPREKGPREKGPRKPRPHGFARLRMTPTHRVEHALESCPECGTGLAGGSAPGKSSTFPWFPSRSPNTSLSPGFAPYVRNVGCPSRT